MFLLNSGGTGSGSKNAHPQARVVSARPRAPSVQCWQCSLSGVVLRGKEKRPFPLNTSSSCVINNVVRGHAPGTPPESILRQEDPAGTCGMLRLRQASCRLCSCCCWGVVCLLALPNISSTTSTLNLGVQGRASERASGQASGQAGRHAGRQAGRLVGRSVAWCVGRPVGRSFGRTVGWSVGGVISWWGRSVDRSAGRLVVGPSFHRSVGRSVGRVMLLPRYLLGTHTQTTTSYSQPQQ